MILNDMIYKELRLVPGRRRGQRGEPSVTSATVIVPVLMVCASSEVSTIVLHLMNITLRGIEGK